MGLGHCKQLGHVCFAANGVTSKLIGFVVAVPRALREALVSWDHRTKIPLPNPLDRNSGAFSKTFDLSGADAQLIDHNVDGRIIIPVSATGGIGIAHSFLFSIWHCTGGST